jgi:hypothetical protein
MKRRTMIIAVIVYFVCLCVGIAVIVFWLLYGERIEKRNIEKIEDFCIEMQEKEGILPLPDDIKEMHISKDENTGAMILKVTDENSHTGICEMTPYDCQILDIYPDSKISYIILNTSLSCGLLTLLIVLVFIEYKRKKKLEAVE